MWNPGPGNALPRSFPLDDLRIEPKEKVERVRSVKTAL